MKNKIITFMITMAAVISLTFTSFTVMAEDDSTRVFDYADILSSEEENELQTEIDRLQTELETDIIILTSPDMEGKSWEAYADDFYDEHAFGYEQEHGTGIIFLISMDSSNRGITITTSGKAIENFTDYEIECMYDDIIEYMKSGEYYEGCLSFLSLTEENAVNSERANNGYYDVEANTWVEYSGAKMAFRGKAVIIRILISMAIAGVIVLILCHKAKTKTSVNSTTYLKGQMSYSQRRDDFINTTERVVKITSDDDSGSGSSSTHTSSGGYSHGGGGGRGF